MNKIQLVDETLDITATSNYHLSIQVSEEGVSYAIFDRNYNKYIQLSFVPFTKEYPFIEDFASAVKAVFLNNEVLQKEYKTVSYSYVTPKVSLIDLGSVAPEEYKTIFEFSHNRDELDEIHTDKLKIGAKELELIYIVPNYLAIDILEFHPNAKFVCQATSLLSISQKKAIKQSKLVYINIYKSFFEIAFYDAGNLNMYNNFKYANENELVYFILHVFNSLNISPDKTEIYVGGSIDLTSADFDLLKRFLGAVKLDKPNDEFTYSYTFSAVENHLFTNLFNQKKCV